MVAARTPYKGCETPKNERVDGSGVLVFVPVVIGFVLPYEATEIFRTTTLWSGHHTRCKDKSKDKNKTKTKNKNKNKKTRTTTTAPRTRT